MNKWPIPLVRIVTKGYNIVTKSSITITVEATTAKDAKTNALHNMPGWKLGNCHRIDAIGEP